MVNYADLRTANPQRWSTIGGILRVWAEDVADCADGLSDVIAGLGARWAGSAATAGLARLTSLRAALADAYPALVGIDQALSEFATTVASAQRELLAAARPRPGSIVEVRPDGSAVLVPTLRPPDAGDDEDLARTRRALTAALAIANSADRQVTARLRLTTFDPDAMVAPSSVPRIGTDPTLVTAWWATLSGDEQRYMIRSKPSIVDGLDGLPADARDQAGRILLHQQLGVLRTQHATAELAGLARLRNRVTDPYADRAYLLDLNASQDHATVSIEDPDRAGNVLTMVPGVGAGLTHIGSTLTTIDNIQGAAGPTADVATIGWVEYDAPSTIEDAMSGTAAAGGAPALSRFDEGLRDTHIGRPAHDSLLGYSYGGTVVGETARVAPLRDDDVIFVGTPGVGVDHATDLGVDPAHVWATVARNDPIRLAANPVTRIEGLLTGHRSQMWFGTAPTASDFGGRTFTSDPGSWMHPVATHVDYFDAGSTSLTNIAKIATGDTDAVS